MKAYFLIGLLGLALAADPKVELKPAAQVT